MLGEPRRRRAPHSTSNTRQEGRQELSPCFDRYHAGMTFDRKHIKYLRLPIDVLSRRRQDIADKAEFTRRSSTGDVDLYTVVIQPTATIGWMPEMGGLSPCLVERDGNGPRRQVLQL